MGGRSRLLLLLLTVASLVWQPRSQAQADAMRSMAPELCYSGRRFGGKSNVGCMKGFTYAEMYPGARVAICREERASMENTTLLTLRTEVVPPEVWAAYWSESKSTLFLPNGSEINVFGLDRPGRQLGSRYGLVVVDQAEQLDYNQFQLINSGVTQVGMPWHQLMLLFNPDSPEHWAFKRYSPDDGDGMRVNEKGREFAQVVHVLPDDLMDILTEESRHRLDDLDGVWRLRYRLGLWASFEGAVYGDLWNPATMVVERPKAWDAWNGYPPADWDRFRAIDFGFNHPYVCQWWARDPEGVCWLYRELYRTGLETADHADRAIALEQQELEALRSAPALTEEVARVSDVYLGSLNVAASVCDPARPDLRATLAGRGIHCYPANNDVTHGIEQVRRMMKAGRLRYIRDAVVDRDPKLVEAKRPWCTHMEHAGYRWQKDRKTNTEVGPREAPLKEHDDGCDAERYLFATPVAGWLT